MSAASSQLDVGKALSGLIDWLQTWKTPEGAYNGYVVHRGDLKRMFKIHDTAWAQAPIIQGYLNLFQKTSNKKWLDEAVLAADLQASRLDRKTGKYIYAGFEDDRFTSLVHCSLANCALLDLAEELTEQEHIDKGNVYLKTVETNIQKYIIDELWDKQYGAFRFAEFDHYFPEQTRFVANMNSVAIESFTKLAKISNDESYLDFAFRAGEWLLTQQMEADSLADGGISYSQIQQGTLITIYTALALRGLDDLYYLTNDERYARMMQKAAIHLIYMIDPKTHLFYHALYEGDLCRYPQFIAGSSLILRAIRDTERLAEISFEYGQTLDAVLANQLAKGGFSNFIGYNTSDNGRTDQDGSEVWEDFVPVVGWNAHLFEFLTQIAPHNIRLNSSINAEQKDIMIDRRAPNYLYKENQNLVIIFGKRPDQSAGFFFYLKKKKYGFNILNHLILRLLQSLFNLRDRIILRNKNI